MQRDVLRRAPQLVQMLPAHIRVLLLQRLLVLNGLRLDVVDLGLAALARVAVEHAGRSAAEPHVGQFLGEIDGVVDTAVHAHAADRIVDVGAVAGEQHAAFVEGRGDTIFRSQSEPHYPQPRLDLLRVILNKYFVDEAYNFWFVKLGKQLANEINTLFEEKFIDGFLVNGVGRFTQNSAAYLRKGQNGFVRSYALSMVIGIVIVLVGCLAGLGRGW